MAGGPGVPCLKIVPYHGWLAAGSRLTATLFSLPSGPTACLLDARAEGWGQERLRIAARALTERQGALYSSRSYRYPFALAAWHGGQVGVDLEVLDQANAVLAGTICTAAERRLLAAAPDQGRYLSNLWSAKEALAKGLGNALLYPPARLGSPSLWPTEGAAAAGATGGAPVVRRAGRWRACALKVPQGYVGWLCWAPAPVPARAGPGIPTGG